MTFDDPELTAVVSPTPTAIEQPFHRIGKSTAQRLLRLIASQSNSKANDPEVIELKSIPAGPRVERPRFGVRAVALGNGQQIIHITVRA
jgi:hypothetical protein